MMNLTRKTFGLISIWTRELIASWLYLCPCENRSRYIPHLNSQRRSLLLSCTERPMWEIYHNPNHRVTKDLLKVSIQLTFTYPFSHLNMFF